MTQWNTHYQRDKSSLSYPDENLVRMVQRWTREQDSIDAMHVLDLGCGSGRHLKLLKETGFNHIYGTDYSTEGLELAKNWSPSLVQCDNRSLPCRDETFNAVVAWGSLHYAMKDDTLLMVQELHRVIKQGGMLFATLRSSHDTMMRRGDHLGNDQWQTTLDDIAGSVVSFFSEDETRQLFSGRFDLSLGLMERTTVGKLDEKVSHWLVQGKRVS